MQRTIDSAYIPELRDYFRRRQVLDATARLNLLAQDPGADSAAVLADTESLLEVLHRQADANALPEIVCAEDFLETGEWELLATEKEGLKSTRIYELIKELEKKGEVHKSLVDDKWEQILKHSANSKS